MSYTTVVVREFETGEFTIRRLVNGKFVIIVCFPYESEPHANDEWRKAHMVHPSYGPGNAPKMYDTFGLAFAAAKKAYRNCHAVPTLSLPLATGDKYTEADLDDVAVH